MCIRDSSITLFVLAPGAASFVPLTGVAISGPGTCVISNTYAFAALISPPNASLPITYTWLPEPDEGQGTSLSRYVWYTVGTYAITVTAQNTGTLFIDMHTVDVGEVAWVVVYLPLVLRESQ